MADRAREVPPSYKILQIIPAQPGTFALYEVAGEDELWRTPVPAWGLWDETNEKGEVTRGAGPLVLDLGGQLEPAKAAGVCVGVRIGDCAVLHGTAHFDDPKAGAEPQRSRA